MKISGIFFGENIDQDNWMPKLKKVQLHLNVWKRRSLALVGRALLVNALGLNYFASVLIVPNWVKKKISEVIWPFLWRKKFEPVWRQTCFCAKGGLGIVNFPKKRSTHKISSVLIMLQEPGRKCFYLLKYFLRGRLAGLREEWSNLRDNASPSALALTPIYDGHCFLKCPRIKRVWSFFTP